MAHGTASAESDGDLQVLVTGSPAVAPDNGWCLPLIQHSLISSATSTTGQPSGWGDARAALSLPCAASAERVSSAEIGNDVHYLVIARTSNARPVLYHGIRYGDGRWQQAGNVFGQVGEPGYARDVAAAPGANGSLNVVLLTFEGMLYHTSRSAAGAWTPWEPLYNSAGPISIPVGVAAGSVNGQLHVVVQDLAGGNQTLRHAVRIGPNNWTQWGNVEAAAGDAPGAYQYDFSLAGSGGVLHLVTTDGHTVSHAIRFANGAWTSFGNVEGQAGDPGGDPTQVAAADAGAGDLHVVTSYANSTGRTNLVRTVRRGNSGAWWNWQTLQHQGTTEAPNAFDLTAT
jgi:hypothetical protein